MLGSDLRAEVARRGYHVTGVDLEELNIADPTAVAEIAAGKFGSPQWCINCAAYTAVDKAESEPDQAMLVNGIAPGYLAQACEMAGIRLIHISTDFVFDGRASQPYQEDAPTNPLGAYGRSKLQGEESVADSSPSAVIVRTAWLYGPNGSSFPKTMIKAWLAGKKLRVVSDQLGTPTYTADLARVLVDLAAADPKHGIYHAAGPEIMTWHELAAKAIETYQKETLGKDEPFEIDPIRSEDWPTPAVRPKFSALSFEKVTALGIEPMRPVGQALRDFVRRS